MVRIVALWVLLAGLTALLWWLPNRQQASDVVMTSEKFNSVSFAPYRAGQSPLTGVFPTAAEVEQDVALVARRTRAIRTYAAIEGEYDVAALAQKYGLKLWQGIWLGGDRSQNAREIARAVEAAQKYPETVERVVVGNEVLLRRDLPVAELIADIDRVRAAVRQPVTYADVWEFWRQFPEVAAHVDVVTIHILPYWEDVPTGIDGAMAHVETVYREMVRLFPGKKIAIGETGWPSRGRWRRDAAPGLVNQVLFLRRFMALAGREGFDYNFIEAFDQVWKYRSEGVVGANWGLWTADRAEKFPLNGAVAEYAGWPFAAGLAVLLAAFLLVAGGRLAWVAPFALAARNWAGLSVLAVVLGNALAFAWAAATPDLYDLHVRIAAVGNLLGQAVLALLLQARLTGRLAGRAVMPARTGAQATATVRAVLLLRWGRLARWRVWLFGDLSFVFLWTAAVLQLLLVFDPRYRDFPLPVFAVPLVAVAARALWRDLPLAGGGREEFWVGLVLAGGAVASAVIEGPLNRQSLVWNAAALVLAAGPLASLQRVSQAQPPSAKPSMPQLAL